MISGRTLRRPAGSVGPSEAEVDKSNAANVRDKLEKFFSCKPEQRYARQ
jgi:hypothetical protein